MLHCPLARCIRKLYHAFFFQRNPFHFYKRFFLFIFHIQIKPGILIGNFRSDNLHVLEPSPGFNPFLHHFVCHLGIHIDQPVSLPDTDQVPASLTPCTFRLPDKHFCSRNQKFRAPPCVLHMDRFFFSIYFYFCCKSIRAL